MARSLSDGSALSPSSFPFSGRGSRAEPILTRWPVVQTQRRGHAGARRCQLPSEPPTLTPQPRSPARGSELPSPSWSPAPRSAVPLLSTVLTSRTGLQAPSSAPDKTPVLTAAPRSAGAPSRRQKLPLLPAVTRRGSAAVGCRLPGLRFPRAPLPPSTSPPDLGNASIKVTVHAHRCIDTH